MGLQSGSESWCGLAELRPALKRFLDRHCRDDSEADDVAQDTLLRAWRYRASLADSGRLRPWLLRIALNVLRDHVRRERRLPRIETDQELLDRVEGREDVPGDVREDIQVQLDGALVEKPRALDHLCDARDGLRSRDRTVLDSHYREGRSCRETAQVCEIPQDLVKVRLFRARKRLRRALRSRLRIEADPEQPPPATPGIRQSPRTDRGAQCAAAWKSTEGAARGVVEETMKASWKGPGILGPMLSIVLASAVTASPRCRFAEAASVRAGPNAGDPAKGVEAVPKLESAAAQLAHAVTLRSGMRGKEGDAKNAVRKSSIEAFRAVREYWGGDAKICAEASFHAGELLRAANDTPAALEEFQIAKERGVDTPFRVRAELEIAHVHRRGQDHEKALRAYEAVLAEAGATPGQRDDASYWEGHVYASAKRIEDARRTWQRVAEAAEDPLDRIRAWDSIAGSFVDAGDLEGASGTLEKCREAMAEASAEETHLGERVRRALLGMRSVEDLQRAIAKRDNAKSDGKKPDDRPSREVRAEKK